MDQRHHHKGPAREAGHRPEPQRSARKSGEATPRGDDLRALLRRVMGVDRERLEAALARLEARSGSEARTELARVEEAIRRSAARREDRERNQPRPGPPPPLPISAMREEIIEAVRHCPALVICGETGSGKSTQLPQLCLEAGRGVTGMIAHTQPRRLAARAVAARVAEELRVQLGREVGYKIRFNDRSTDDTYIKLVTDGVLLAELQSDRRLSRYDTIIVDEAHERSLNIDFLLGYLQQLLERRDDLRVIVTSATIDPDRFSRHFGGAPVIEVPGRTFPVEVLFRPALGPDGGPVEGDLAQQVAAAVEETLGMPAGDALVFLPGEREIREAVEAVAGLKRSLEVVPLFSRLSEQEQQRIFQKHSGRRVVLATNVAETSLTVPGIRYVIDSGLARLGRYSPRTKVQGLPVEAVSRASADQRKGRCGRVGPGVCIRLYAEEDYVDRPEFTEPEIVRSNLAAVILQMKAMRLGEPEQFPFIDRPHPRLVRDGHDTLVELGALDAEGRLTALGARMARFPIDPRLARIILAAERENALPEVLMIVAALSMQDPRERPLDQRAAADEAHARLAHPESDFITLLNLRRLYEAQGSRSSRRGVDAWCRERFLSARRMREWNDVHRQLSEMCAELGVGRPNGRSEGGARAPRAVSRPAPERMPPTDGSGASEQFDHVPRALLAGLLVNVGRLGEESEYNGTHGSRFSIFPGSTLFQKVPKWVMAAEMVRTSRLFARTVARVRPEWIEEFGAHLVTRAYSEPEWSERTATVLVHERVSLFGLELIAGRRVNYANINPVGARELFIHHALVEDGYATEAPFALHNRALIEEARALEAKARRHDLVETMSKRFEFFAARLPPDVCSGGSFERWRHRAERDNPRVLFMQRANIVRQEAAEVTPELFPDEIARSGVGLGLSYRFAPGEEDDGVTVDIPLPEAAVLRDDVWDWTVPGAVGEMVRTLLEQLPKAIRKTIPPAGQIAGAFLASKPPTNVPLAEALGAFIRKSSGVEVPRSAWSTARLPDHLRVRFHVRDDRNTTVAQGRDLEQVRQEVRGRVVAGLESIEHEVLNRGGYTAWTFGELPESLDVESAGVRVRAYPAVVDERDAVGVRLFASPAAARVHAGSGLRRLLALVLRRELKAVLDHVPAITRLRLNFAPLGPVASLHDQLGLLIAARAGEPDAGVIRSSGAFEKALERARAQLARAAIGACEPVDHVLAAHQRVQERLARPAPALWAEPVREIREHLRTLVHERFIEQTPAPWLRHLPRFLRAIETRLEKLAAGKLELDRRAADQLREPWERLKSLPNSGGEFRWVLEEFRVSLFAQELRTSIPVSPKRVEEEWRTASRALLGLGE